MYESDERLKNSIFVVEADSYGQFALWKEFHDQVDWEEDSRGFSQQIGEIADMPVYISVSFAKICGQQVCFYYGSSMVTHHDMLESWIMEKCGQPKYDGGHRRAHCDALNFNHCIGACEDASEKKRKSIQR
jgi:hypothetical protein